MKKTTPEKTKAQQIQETIEETRAELEELEAEKEAAEDPEELAEIEKKAEKKREEIALYESMKEAQQREPFQYELPKEVKALVDALEEYRDAAEAIGEAAAAAPSFNGLEKYRKEKQVRIDAVQAEIDATTREKEETARKLEEATKQGDIEGALALTGKGGELEERLARLVDLKKTAESVPTYTPDTLREEWLKVYNAARPGFEAYIAVLEALTAAYNDTAARFVALGQMLRTTRSAMKRETETELYGVPALTRGHSIKAVVPDKAIAGDVAGVFDTITEPAL